MKIKEKGLKGKAAQRKRDNLSGNNPRRGFNAFAEMRQNNKQNGKEGGGKKEAQKKEVFLEFMGKKLKVNEEDGGKVDEAEIPMVKRSALKIKGLNGTMTFDEVKVRFGNFHYLPVLLIDELYSGTLTRAHSRITLESLRSSSLRRMRTRRVHLSDSAGRLRTKM